MRLPIVRHHWPSPARSDLRRAVSLAVALRKEKRALGRQSQFDAFACRQLDDAPTLHIDDYSEIPLPNRERHAVYMQQRACLRAAPGDWVATTQAVDRGYVDYFEQQLGITPLNWVVAESVSGPAKLAVSCIRSRNARRKLSHAIRREGLRYIHPHLASFDVWELAAWLHEFTRMPIEVIGPPVEVCRFANDKVEFAELVTRLLGERFIPKTIGAYCVATLSDAVQDLARKHPCLGVKVPNGVGGHGNVFVDAQDVLGRSLSDVHEYLSKRLSTAGISPGEKMLVDVWETEVLKSGSVQTWIPPITEGPSVIEGLFEQIIQGEQGHFEGSRQLKAPEPIVSQLINQSFLLTTVFQQLGYVGRCSFDFLLVGDSMDSARVEYIECNGRWGGTSAPMTFVNRLVGDCDHERTFETYRVADPAFSNLTFPELALRFGSQLYDVRTGTGNTVLFNPARASVCGEIEVARWETKSPSLRRPYVATGFEPHESAFECGL